MSGSPSNNVETHWFTDQETTICEKTMLSAALKALGTLPDLMHWDDRSEKAMREIPRRVVQALAAATHAKRAEEKRLSKTTGKRAISFASTAEIVSSAFWARMIEAEGLTDELGVLSDDLPPITIGGSCLLMFAQGIAAAVAAENALDLAAIQDDSPLDFIDHGATTIAESWRQ